MSERINAENMTVHELAKYIGKGYELRLTKREGFVLFKLEIVGDNEEEELQT